MRALRLPVSLLAAALVAQPALAGDPFKPSAKDQIELGQRAAASLREEEKVLPDSDPRVQELRKLGRLLVSLIPESEREKTGFQYTFDVIDSEEVNAFALPGGPIFFYTGLLDELTTEDQVAGILAHEIVHVRKQHWASAYADNQKRQLGITALLLLLNANETAFDLASITDAVVFSLPYSRKHERESDRIGFDMMVEANYNPQGLADVFAFLKEKGGGSGNPEWMSSHPDSSNRIKDIEKRIANSDKTFPPQKERSQLSNLMTTFNKRMRFSIIR